MDITNSKCIIGVQNNAETIIVHSTPSNINSKDFHLLKTVKSFKGRDDELEQLSTWLFQDKKKMAVICGLPGYGKTELARHFAHLCKERELVRSVLWLDAETPSVLENSFRELLRCLGAIDKAELDVRSVVEHVSRHFSAEPHLFVLDNALDRRHVLGFEPDGECRCVVTSHLEDWGDDVPALKLAPLPLNAAVDVLRAELQHRFHDEDEDQYKHLAELLSRVPLALQVAAAYVRQEVDDLQEDFHLCEYMDRLQAPSTEVIDQPLPGCSANLYDKTFLQAIQISLHKIHNASNYDSKLATDILHICAFLNPEQICYTTLLEIPCLKKVLENFKNPKNHLKQTCALLRKYSFISVEIEKISIHRLIQQILSRTSKDHIYLFCLEILLAFSKNTELHSQFILKHAEHRLEIFSEFYTKYKLEILNKYNFFWHVINSNCKIFLKIILDELGDGAADVINARSLLHLAAKCEQHDILELLLANYKPHVDERDVNENTALMLAAWRLDLRAMKTLALYEADVNAVDAEGDSILHEVILAAGHALNFRRSLEAVEAVRWLVGRGARTDVIGQLNMSLVHAASQALNPDLVRCLVRDFSCDVNAVNAYTWTPLYYVSMTQTVDRERQQGTVRCLLELGARRDVKDAWGRTPAEDARMRGYSQLANYIENPSVEIEETKPVVYELLDSVARGDLTSLIRLLGELGERALQVSNESCLLFEAVRHEKCDILEMLLTRGVDVDCRITGNLTPLHLAVWKLNKRAMELLVDHGADVNDCRPTGISVLHDLVRGAGEIKRVGRGDEACEALQWLVGRGARMDAVISAGCSLLHVATEGLCNELVRYLVTEYSLDVNAADDDGWTPLFWVSEGLRFWHAEEMRGLSTAACLLELGAHAHVLDARGDTPTSFAHSHGYAKLSAFLGISVVSQMLRIKCNEAETATDVEDDRQARVCLLADTPTAAVNDVQVQMLGIEYDEADTATAAAAVYDVQVQDMTWTWWQQLCRFCCCRRHR